jgi:hypothetical protein
MMLAMNATEDAAGGWDIAPPLANRVGWLDWPAPEAAGFVSYLMGQGGAHEAPLNPAKEEAEVDAVFPAAFARAAGEVAGFVSAKSDNLFKMPALASKQVSAAWPSPRTWHMATHAKAAGYVYDLTDKEIDDSVTAFVGSGAAGEFHTWCKQNDLPDPAEFLDGTAPFSHDPKRLDRTAAVLTSATSLVVQGAANTKFGSLESSRNATRSEALWQFHHGLAKQAPDLALGSVVAMCKAKLMIGSASAYKVLAAMEPIMSAAGISAGRS